MRKLLFLWMMLFSNTIYSQNEPVYSHYMFNSISFNPAFTGNYDKLHLQSTYRMQWLGIDGAPRTLQASVDARIYKQMSAGIEVLQDKIGDFSNSKLYGNYAYRININDKSRVSFGLAMGLEIMQFQKTELINLDPIFNNTQLNSNRFNARAGVHYSNSNFYIGLSSTSLIQQENYFLKNKVLSNRNYFLTTGYLLKIAEELVIYPSMLYKEDFNNASYFNFTTMFGYKSTIWAGLSVRKGFDLFTNTNNSFGNNTSEVMGILIDYELNDLFRIGYNFDYSLSYLNQIENGSHEFSISYFLNSKKSIRMLNPRYL